MGKCRAVKGCGASLCSSWRGIIISYCPLNLPNTYVRHLLDYNKPLHHEFHFQTTQYTCSICPGLCRTKYQDYYDLFILKSQRIAAVCITNQLVS